MFLSTQCLDGAVLHQTDGLHLLMVGDTMNDMVRIGPSRPDTMTVIAGERVDRATLPQSAHLAPKMQPKLVRSMHGKVTKDPKEQLQLSQLRIHHQAVQGLRLIFVAEWRT